MKLSPYYKGYFPYVFFFLLVLKPLCSIRGRGMLALVTSRIIVDASSRRALGKKSSIGYTSSLVSPFNLLLITMFIKRIERHMDRCSASMGVPGRHLLWERRH
jgi:hypothetical protein